MPDSRALAALSVLAFCATPAVAGAATVTTPACVNSEYDNPASGTGFPASDIVVLDYGAGASGTADADATGTFSGTWKPPVNTSFTKPLQGTLTARSFSDPNVRATTRFSYIRFGSNFPVNGKTNGVTTWRFGGWATGKPIYGHYRYGGQTLKHFRFGTASGPCGTLLVRARRLPVKRPRVGTWTLQIDQRPNYTPNPPLYDRKSFFVG
jgi:hypothetical protein